jgi:hypothetical protein
MEYSRNRMNCKAVKYSGYKENTISTPSFSLDGSGSILEPSLHPLLAPSLPAPHYPQLHRLHSSCDCHCLSRSTLEGLAEHEELNLIVDGEHTSTGDTTQNVSTSTLEEGSEALSSHDLTSSIEGTLVFNGLQD